MNKKIKFKVYLILMALMATVLIGCFVAPTLDNPNDPMNRASVTQVPVAGVILTKSTTSIIASSTEQLFVIITPGNATTQSLTWSSSDQAKATVNTSGLVTGVAPGSATITVTTVDGNFTANCAVTISATAVPVTGVTLNKASTSIVAGSTEQMTATFTPADATNQNITWSSSDQAKATVNTSGLVTGVAAGAATITVTTADGNFTASCTVTVSAVPVPVTGVNLNKGSTSINVGSTDQLTATLTPINATNQNLTWLSSDPTKATVSASGLVTGVATGPTTITVTTVDGSFTANCTVTVVVTVIYNGSGATGGTVPADSNNYAQDATVTVLGKGSLVKMQDGISLLFVGWCVNADGTGTTYTQGQTFAIGSTNFNLYAKWSVLRGTGPAGGLIFYDYGSYTGASPNWRYMEAAPYDQSTGAEWGCEGTLISGADGQAMGNGYQNTNDIVAGCSTSGIAAKLCADLVLGGYGDWFLPSNDELASMRSNLYSSGVGGFSTSASIYYWSSSESSGTTLAWRFVFNGGGFVSLTKSTFCYVRAARRF